MFQLHEVHPEISADLSTTCHETRSCTGGLATALLLKTARLGAGACDLDV
jgi:hypothetical protein